MPALSCPVCGAATPHDEIQRVLNRMGVPDWMSPVARGQAVPWACEGCLSAERALIADTTHHTNVPTMGPIRRRIYRPMELRCGRCRARFEFTAREQRYWYEELCIPLETVRTRCDPCQARHMANKRVMALVPRADPDNLDHAIALARDYAILGSTDKQRRWEKRAAALRALGHTPTPRPAPQAPAEERDVKAIIRERKRQRRRARRERRGDGSGGD